MNYEDAGEKALVNVGGRRFILVAATLLLCVALTWIGKIDGNILRDIVIGIVGIYVTGNTVQKVKTTKSTTTTTTEEPA